MSYVYATNPTDDELITNYYENEYGDITHCGRAMVIEDCDKCYALDPECSVCFAFRCTKCGGRGTYDCEEAEREIDEAW